MRERKRRLLELISIKTEPNIGTLLNYPLQHGCFVAEKGWLSGI